jgi:hypothetical protein
MKGLLSSAFASNTLQSFEAYLNSECGLKLRCLREIIYALSGRKICIDILGIKLLLAWLKHQIMENFDIKSKDARIIKTI